VEPAGYDANAGAAGQHERPQVDVARRDAFVDAGRASRQRQRRLRDEILRRGLELGAELLDRDLARRRSDQHAVAAGAVHFLHHQLV